VRGAVFDGMWKPETGLDFIWVAVAVMIFLVARRWMEA
jgi:hypothetical protein